MYHLPYIEDTIIRLDTSSNILVQDEYEDKATGPSEVRNINFVCVCVALFKEVLRLLGNFTCTLRYVVLPQY